MNFSWWIWNAVAIFFWWLNYYLQHFEYFYKFFFFTIYSVQLPGSSGFYLTFLWKLSGVLQLLLWKKSKIMILLVDWRQKTKRKILNSISLRSNHCFNRWQYNELKNGISSGIYRLGNVFAFYNLYNNHNKEDDIHFTNNVLEIIENNIITFYCDSAWNDSLLNV